MRYAERRPEPEATQYAPVLRPVFGGYPVDPDFPQLEVAFDSARMLEVFRAHLKPVAGTSCHILSCRPFRFRCRQSTSRCVLQYTLRVLDPRTGRQWDQWVSGLLYAEPGKAERVWQELRATVAAQEIPETLRSFEPVSFIPELDMTVEVFPFDRRLPQLSRVLDGASRDIASLLLERLGPGRWQPAEATLEPTRYRTELGAAFRYAIIACDAETGRRETLSCYLKVYRHDGGSQTFKLLSSWRQRARTRRSYSLVAPIAYWSELRILLLEEAKGRSLNEILLEDGTPENALRASARALALFHQNHLRPTRVFRLADQLDAMKRASVQVQWACPHLRKDLRDITATVAARLRDVPPTPIHGDLKPEHVLVSEGRPVFIDLDSVTLGDPARDPAHFYSYVAGRVGLEQLPLEKARALALAFADEYFSRVPGSWREQFALHCAEALVEVACGIFRHHQPRWREQVTAALEEARYALAGRVG
jgi:streptomycin 6-kinase